MRKMHGAYERLSTIPLLSEHAELPERLQISYDCDINPWKNLFMQDFIMVAEFSEHEGPRPLFTIPDDAGKLFDKNAFSVHVMSVDYHAQSGMSFSLVDDTQLIFSEDRENIYAYVHHFILHDIEARGFVRPFCMCYISNSKKKIMKNLESFIHEFSKISNHFKAANKPLFLDDLKQRLTDLNYVKACHDDLETEHSEWVEVSQNACKNFHGLNKESVDSMLIEANKAIDVLKASKIVSRKSSVADNEFEKTTTEDSGMFENTCVVEMPNDTPNVQDTSCYELSNGGKIHDEIIERLVRERKRHLLTLRDIHALCGYRAVEGLASLQRLHQNFYQPCEVFSVIKEETPLLNPFSSTFAIGSSFVINFRNGINLSKAYATANITSDPYVSVDSFESARSDLSNESFQSCVEENESFAKGYAGDRHFFQSSPFSVMTNKDLSGGGNFSDVTSERTSLFTASPSSASLADLSDNSTIEGSCTATPLVPDPHPNLTRRLHSGSTGDLPSATENSIRTFQRQFSAVETQSYNVRDRINDLTFSPKNVPVDEKSEGQDTKHFGFGSTPQYKVIYRNMDEIALLPGSDSLPRGVGEKGRFEKISLQCYAQQLCRRKSDGPGGGMLRVLRRYGYLVHLLYALLSGRTVVVLADPSHQRYVEPLITSLWLFVPGDCKGSQKVVLWRTKPLKLSDLGRIKLVGLAKSKQFSVLPNSVQTYVSTLDFDTGLLSTPSYQGQFLNRMLAFRNVWKSDAMFISYIHSVFLEMSLKAFVCYFAISLRNSATDANLPWKKRAVIPRDFSLEFMTDVLDALGILGSDARIILYFLDLLSHQHLADLPNQRNFSDNASFDSVSTGSGISYENSDSSIHMTKTDPITLEFAQRVEHKKSRERQK